MISTPNRPKLRRLRLVAVDCSATVEGAPMVKGPRDAALIARNILPTDREGFVVIHLDARHRVRSIELASVGTLNASLVHPREVFKAAILANAHGIIVAHNHPSGDPTPSEEDGRILKRLVGAGDLLGIGVLDSLVITESGYVSMMHGNEDEDAGAQ